MWDGEIQQVSEQTMRYAARRAKENGETTEQYLERLMVEYTDGRQEEIKEANIRGVEIQMKNTLDYYIQPKSMDAIRRVRVNYI